MQKKVCMLGAPGVGKTSLVARFVHSVFSEKYHTTLGVKIDKKPIVLESCTLDLILWDINGEDDFQSVRPAYIRGASGCLLVVDGTRRETLDSAVKLGRWAEKNLGQLPLVLAFNKIDLKDAWVFDEAKLDGLAKSGWRLQRTSAKTGSGVEEAFQVLARGML